MPATKNKHSALRTLRQRLSLPELPDSPRTRSQTLKGDRLDPALFTGGLHEMVSETPGDFTAALAFALSAAGQKRGEARPLFFAAPASEGQERGLLHGAGLDRLGLDPAHIVLMTAPSEKDLLWAAEEAVSCSALGGAVIALGAREELYGFTASRRLKLRQEASGVPLFLVRCNVGDATAATARWHVASASSEGQKAPGAPVPLLGLPRFRVRLERYAGMAPQQWEIELDEAYTLRVASPLSDRPADTRRIKAGRAA